MLLLADTSKEGKAVLKASRAEPAGAMHATTANNRKRHRLIKSASGIKIFETFVPSLARCSVACDDMRDSLKRVDVEAAKEDLRLRTLDQIEDDFPQLI